MEHLYYMLGIILHPKESDTEDRGSDLVRMTDTWKITRLRGDGEDLRPGLGRGEAAVSTARTASLKRCCLSRRRL